MVSEEQLDAPRPQGQWTLAWRRFKRDRVAVGCGIFLLLVVFLVGPGAPVYEKIVGHGPNDFFPYAVSVGLRPAGPFTVTWDTPQMAGDDPFALTHPDPPKTTDKTLLLLGADSQLGRDEFLRVLYGGRVSLTIAAGAALFAILSGPVILAVTMVAAAAIIVLNLIADLVLLAIDPTVTRRGRGVQRLLGRAG